MANVVYGNQLTFVKNINMTMMQCLQYLDSYQKVLLSVWGRSLVLVALARYADQIREENLSKGNAIKLDP